MVEVCTKKIQISQEIIPKSFFRKEFQINFSSVNTLFNDKNVMRKS